MLDGLGSPWPPALVIADGEQARAAVRELRRRGAAFVKVHELLTRDAFFAAADEAGAQKLPLGARVCSRA